MDESFLRGIVKKMNIVDRTGRDRWHKEIHLVLSDISIARADLDVVHRFRPDDLVEVTLTAAQLSLFPTHDQDEEGDELICGEPVNAGEVVKQSFTF